MNGSPAESPAWEALALVKRQQRERARAWAELLEVKERALAEALERLSRAEAEAADLRSGLRHAEGETLARLLEAEQRAQALSEQSLQERAKQAAERASLQELLESARGCLAAEGGRFAEERRLWEAKVLELEQELASVASLSFRHQEEAARFAEALRRRDESLGEAKKALERSLAELLAQRGERDEARRERDESLNRLAESRRHYAELSRLWDEERRQWGALAGVPAPAQAPVESFLPPAPAVEAPLVDTASAPVPEAPPPPEPAAAAPSEAWPEPVPIEPPAPEAAEPEPPLPSVEAAPEPAPAPAAPRGPSLVERAKAWLAGLLARPEAIPRLAALSLHPVELDRPSGLAFDGRLLWAAEEGGRLVAFDTQYFEAVRAVVIGQGAYRPVGLASGGGALWSLDEAQGRILRHDPEDPGRILAELACPTERPRGLAFDGEALWVWGSETKAFLRIPAAGGAPEPLTLAGDALPLAMAWVDGRLWVFDALSARLLVLERRGSELEVRSRHDLGAALLGLCAGGGLGWRRGRLLWTLARTDEGRLAVVRYGY